MLYELILINEIEQRAKIIFLSVQPNILVLNNLIISSQRLSYAVIIQNQNFESELLWGKLIVPFNLIIKVTS